MKIGFPHRPLPQLFAILLASVMAGGAAERQPTPVLFKLPSGALSVTNSDPSGSPLKSFVLPIESMRGAYVFVEANVKAEDVSTKSQPWNGIKLMVKIETPGRTDWP